MLNISLNCLECCVKCLEQEWISAMYTNFIIIIITVTDNLKIESVSHELQWLLIVSNSRVLQMLQ